SEESEAVERANASSWGLGGSVWSSDLDKAYALAEKMDAGTIWINKHAELDPGIPFGGAKQSGIGKELGEEGLQEFTQLKIINMAKAS
ncbi:MAG: aldehyde dehydrogenase family protein, partial [Pseudomonadales bacterium]|nr:aldehyde dehydrogenase family protein [Pseudomonadales bacterium]